MASPPSFNNTVILVTGSPVGASEINAELVTQNVAGYWMTSLEFVDANNAVLLFVKNNTAYTPAKDQKVNAVAVSQAAIDADKATEIASGWWPTGIFVTPGADLLILYSELFPTT
jgi:hypothetical protein